MSIQKCLPSNNVMPSAAAETKENNGITIICNGKGTYTISGTSNGDVDIRFTLPSFITPISIGQGGNGTLSFFNSGTGLTVYFMNGDTVIDNWNMNQINRTNTVYSAIGNKEINGIRFALQSGVTIDITVSPMFTNDGQLPSEFVPHLIFKNWFYRKRETATDTITTLPADVIADGQSASAVIKGNMSQTGTPTPASPIYPSETGDKTANLCEKVEAPLSQYRIYIENFKSIIDTYSTFTLSFDTQLTYAGNTLYLYVGSNVALGYISGTGSITKTFSLTAKNIEAIKNAVSPYIFVYVNNVDQSSNTNAMINTGSTALPFEPFGYKIPILSGGVTTPVYLGQVQSTRQIAKIEFKGTENFSKNEPDNPDDYIYWINLECGAQRVVCSHIEYKSSIPAGDNAGITTRNGRIMYINASKSVMNAQTSGNTVNGLKEYLAAQYANSTPVTVWYVLATQTTGIVNEPIRKIGSYSDSVSVSNLPTTGTAEQFDVDTDLKPSEVDLTYHGWHEHSDTKF